MNKLKNAKIVKSDLSRRIFPFCKDISINTKNPAIKIPAAYDVPYVHCLNKDGSTVIMRKDIKSVTFSLDILNIIYCLSFFEALSEKIESFIKKISCSYLHQ